MLRRPYYDVLFTRHYDHLMAGDEMGGVCSTHCKDQKHRVLVGKPERKDCLDDLCIGKMMLLKCILTEVGVKCVDGIHLAQSMADWRVVVLVQINSKDECENTHICFLSR